MPEPHVVYFIWEASTVGLLRVKIRQSEFALLVSCMLQTVKDKWSCQFSQRKYL